VGTHIDPDRYARFLQLTKKGAKIVPRLLQKDFNFKGWDDSPERFANDLYERSNRNLA
jgi:hypothetical protein